MSDFAYLKGKRTFSQMQALNIESVPCSVKEPPFKRVKTSAEHVEECFEDALTNIDVTEHIEGASVDELHKSLLKSRRTQIYEKNLARSFADMSLNERKTLSK